MKFTDTLNFGGQFTFPTNQLTKNQKAISGTNYKRNRGIPKSDRTMYHPNRIRFHKKGNKLITLNDFKPVDAVGFEETLKEIIRPYVPDIVSNIIQNSNLDQYSDILKYKSLDEIQQELVNDDEYTDDTSSSSYIQADSPESLKGVSLQTLINEENLPLIITSSYRKGSKTKSGNPSYHSLLDENGNPLAYDIQPFFDGEVDKTKEGFARLTEILMTNNRVMLWMQENGFGLLDESYKAAMDKTGATGPHFHIGKDLLAIKGLARLKQKFSLDKDLES